ncbi:hypothetical protein ACHAWF_007748 [Thalassiosira exigua]
MKTALLLSALLLVSLPDPVVCAASSSHSQHAQGHRPATSILSVRTLHHPLHGGTGSGTAGTPEAARDDFDRLNARNERRGRGVAREDVREAVFRAGRHRPSKDIVVMGAASWN